MAVMEDRNCIEFEPYHIWRRNEKIKLKIKQRSGEIHEVDRQGDILDVHLHGFKKEQLKASTNGKTLKLTGETKLDENNDNTWRKFSTEVDISKQDYQKDQISAIFSHGVLSLKMPKKVPKRQALKEWLESEDCQRMMKRGKDLVKITVAGFLGMTVGCLTSYIFSKMCS